MPSYPWPKTVSLARRVEPRRAPWSQKRKFQERGLDRRGDRGAQMAAVPRPLIHQDGDPMTKAQRSLTSVAEQPGRGPARVRVRLRHAGTTPAKIYPPDGESRVWWTR